MPTFRPDKRASPLLSQTATGRWPGGKPWESQPERRQAIHEPTRRYEPEPAPTGTHIQVGGSVRYAPLAVTEVTTAQAVPNLGTREPSPKNGDTRRRRTAASPALFRAQIT